MNNLVDVHCHLSEENIFSEVPKAVKAGITRFISSALCQEEFEWHMNTDHSAMKWSAGIHPNYKKSKESDFQTLVKLCDQKKIIALGEVGLDKRNKDSTWQKAILLKQLDLAANYDLPVIFHVVHQYYELHKLLKNNFPKIRGFLHAFSASKEIAETFSKYDLAFSIGCKHPKLNCLEYIAKRGFLLFETDAPYQKPPDSKQEENHLINLLWNVKTVSKLLKIQVDDLIEIQVGSYRSIF
ncbi:MAG: TatD family hydrolase [Candidatus Cloacimonetes bacterium]|nr:TatD family hydrolase [Candidatus Cloacimonadota bacterium]